MRVRHLLTMQTGLEWNEWELPLSSRRNDLNRYYRSRRPNEFLLGRKLVAEPGTEFRYNTPSTPLPGELLQRATGQPFEEYAEEHLFQPLGIDQAAWRPNNDGVPGTTTAGDGLFLTPRDMLRIGQLVLQRGSWNGRQIVSGDWLDRMTEPIVPLWEGVPAS